MNTEIETYEALAYLKDGRTATVTVEAEDKEEAKYFLHHCGRALNIDGVSHDVDHYDYRTVKPERKRK